MGTDNTLLNLGTGGNTVRTLVDGSSIEWPAGVCAYATTISAGANVLQEVTPAHGLPVQPQSGATFPVSAASLPLPSGAATASNQATEITGLAAILSALGGTLTVSVSALPTGLSTSARQDTGNTSLASIDGKITACNTGAVVVSAALPAGTNVIGHVIVDSGIITTVTAVTSITNVVHIDDNGGSITVDGTVAFSNTTIAVTNTGIFAVQATLSAETTKIIGTVNIASAQTVGIAAGSAVIGHVIVDSGTITTVSAVTAITNPLPAGSNVIGKVSVDQTTPGTTNAVQDIAATSGGLSISSFLSTAAVQATAVKASAGQVYSLEFFNVGAAAVYVRLYNQTTTPGTGDTVVWRGVVPGNTAGAGFVKTWDKGLTFSTGIGMRCTAAIADNDNTSLSANGVIGNVCYK